MNTATEHELSLAQKQTATLFLALYDIVQGSRGATCVALRTGRCPQTVMGWLHACNAHGPDALVYRRSGGRPPFVLALRLALAKPSAPPGAPPLPRP